LVFTVLVLSLVIVEFSEISLLNQNLKKKKTHNKNHTAIILADLYTSNNFYGV